MASALATACFLVGLAAIVAGAWIIAPWLGLIIGGSLVAAIALLYARGSLVARANRVVP